MGLHEPGETESSSAKATAPRRSHPIRWQEDGIYAEVSTLSTRRRSLVDRLAALEISDQANIMRRLIRRASASAALHGFQPRSAGTAPTAELAWDTVRTFWTTLIVPPPSSFYMWTLLSGEAWVQLETGFNNLMRRSYAIYLNSQPQQRAKQVYLLYNLYLLRFYIMGTLRNAPEGYMAGVAGAISAAHSRDDTAAASARVAEAAAGLKLTKRQLRSLNAAWLEFATEMATIAADAAMLLDVLERLSAAAQSAEREAKEANKSMSASTMAMYSLSIAVAKEALGRCNTLRLSAYLALAWDMHEHLKWWQCMELLCAADGCRLDYVTAITMLLASGSGGCADSDSGSTASSAAGEDSS